MKQKLKRIGANSLKLLLIVGGISLSTFSNSHNANAATITGNLLNDAGFEPGTLPLVPYASGIGRWGNENANLIVGSNNGIDPFAGSGMVRLNETGGIASQVVQFVDVTAWEDAIDEGRVTAQFNMFANSPSSATGVGFSLQGRTIPSNAIQTFLGGASKGIQLDADSQTWEQLSLDDPFLLPVGTRSVRVDLAATNGTLPQGAFLDNADLRLTIVPEPMTILGTLTALAFGVKMKRKVSK